MRVSFAPTVHRGASALAAVGIAALSMVLAGCAPTLPETPASTKPSTSSTTEPAEEAQFVPSGSAVENEPYFARVLAELAASDSPIEGEPIVNAVVDAGFEPSAMQVTFDRSKTNLVADSILVSVLVGSECLIGQVVTSDRSVTTTVQPALTDAQNICLLGNTRPIDW